MKTRLLCSFAAIALTASATVYVQTNLVSDIPGLALNTDANLKNPWGLSFLNASPFWASDQATGLSTLYNGAGTPQALVVTIPPAAPTGTVGNTAGAGNFGNANFLFDTLAGTIDSWSGGTTAAVAATGAAGSAYTGLTLIGTTLYAANFGLSRIDAYDSTFAPVTTAGGFTDGNLPSGYSPYNIQAINGQLFVEYALVNPTTHRPTTVLGDGIVDVFNSAGTLVQRLITTGGQLDAPWGVAIAPANFGAFSNDLLVGNFGNGMINAFNPATGAFLGTLTDASGSPIVDSGLWALMVRTSGPGVNPNAVYFNAGINNEADGLFGSIQATPEPGTVAIAAFGLLSLLRLRRVRR